MIAKSQPESERMMAIRQLLVKSVRFGHFSTGHAFQARRLLPRTLYTTSLPQAQVARTDVDGLSPTYVTSLATERVNTMWLMLKDSSILKELLLDYLGCAPRDLRTTLLRAQTICGALMVMISSRSLESRSMQL